MCCGGSSEKSSIPGYLQEAGKNVIGKAESFYDKPYDAYSGQRQAGFTGDQQSAFQGLRDYVGGGGTQALADEGTGMMRQAGNAPGSQVSTERVVDENGRLGAFSDYFNPYVNQVLQPALRQIDEGGAQERNRIGGMAQSAGAFGDARQGILEKDLAGEMATARGDVTSRAYSDAFGQAMGAREGDLNRFFNADTTNANLNETQLGRLMQGGGALTGQASTQQGDIMSRLNALLSTGTQQQQQAQTGLDIPYQAHEAQRQDEYDRLASLVSVIGGVPYARSTQTNDGGAGIMSGIGSLLGGMSGF